MRFIFLFALVGIGMGAAASGCEAENSTDDGGGGGQGGNDFTPRPLYEAGSRLTPRVMNGGDGAEILVGFFDNELQVACTFMETADGELRCLPENSEVGVALFSDSACTTPAILETPCVTAPYATRFEQDPCKGYRPVEVFRKAGATPGAMAYNLTSTGCFAFPEQTGGALQAAEAVPMTDFVSGTIEEGAVDGELRFHRIVASDGASMVLTLIRDDYACDALRVGDVDRCVDIAPASMELQNGVPLYVDSTCEGRRAAFYGNPECSANADLPGPLETPMKPGLAIECADEECTTPRFYVLEVDLAMVYTNEGMCTQYLAQELHIAGVGNELPPEALPALETVQIGTGRLRSLAWGFEGEAVIGRRAFHDTQLDVDCVPAVVSGGATRCLPQAPGTWWYADAACSVPLLQGATDETRFLQIVDGAQCTGEVTEVLERGAAHTGAVYSYNDSLPGCEAATNTGDFYAGAPRALTEFVELTAQ